MQILSRSCHNLAILCGRILRHEIEALEVWLWWGYLSHTLSCHMLRYHYLNGKSQSLNLTYHTMYAPSSPSSSLHALWLIVSLPEQDMGKSVAIKELKLSIWVHSYLHLCQVLPRGHLKHLYSINVAIWSLERCAAKPLCIQHSGSITQAYRSRPQAVSLCHCLRTFPTYLIYTSLNIQPLGKLIQRDCKLCSSERLWNLITCLSLCRLLYGVLELCHVKLACPRCNLALSCLLSVLAPLTAAEA